MAQQVLHSRVTIPSTNPVVDPVSFTFVWEATGSDTTIDFTATANPTSQIVNFFNNLHGGQVTKNCVLLGPALSRATNACTIAYTDVTGVLGGGSTGSPFRTDTFTLGSTSGSALPGACCACFALRADYGSAVEHGDMEEIPSTDDAIDQGAPPTHMGRIRPRARLRSRLFFGPLTRDTQSTDGYSLLPAQVADWGSSISGLAETQNIGGHNQFNLVVWSKRAASVQPIRWYFVNESYSYQSRRSDTTQSRVHTWLQVTG